MACKPDVLKQVPLFALLDEEETAVLAGQVELKTFAPRQRIYKMGDPGLRAYVMVSGAGVALILDIDSQAARTGLRSGRSVRAIAGPHRSLRARARSCTMC